MSFGGSASKWIIKHDHSSRGRHFRGYAYWSIHRQKAAHYSVSDSGPWSLSCRKEMGVEHVLLLEQIKLRCESFLFSFSIFVMNRLIFILQLVILSLLWFLVLAQPNGSAYCFSFSFLCCFFLYFPVVISVGIKAVPSS